MICIYHKQYHSSHNSDQLLRFRLRWVLILMLLFILRLRYNQQILNNSVDSTKLQLTVSNSNVSIIPPCTGPLVSKQVSKFHQLLHQIEQLIYHTFQSSRCCLQPNLSPNAMVWQRQAGQNSNGSISVYFPYDSDPQQLKLRQTRAVYDATKHLSIKAKINLNYLTSTPLEGYIEESYVQNL